MKRIDNKKTRKWNICIYGEPGTGKTWAGASSPDPLILLSESQGLEHIRGYCEAHNKEMVPVLGMDNLDDYRMVIRALNGDPKKPFIVRDRNDVIYESEKWPKTIVIDSLTDVLDMVKQALLDEAPPPIQKDGLREMQMRHWNSLKDRCDRFIKSFRDSPTNVVYLCLKKVKDRERTKDKITEAYIGPDLPTVSLSSVLLSTVNICGMTVREKRFQRDPDGKTVMGSNGKPLEKYVYAVCTRGVEHMVVKPSEKLNVYEKPDVSLWIRKLESNKNEGEKLN